MLANRLKYAHIHASLSDRRLKCPVGGPDGE